MASVRIRVPGGAVACARTGDDGGAGGAPILLLHGGPGAGRRQLEPLVAPLARDRPVVGYDQLGCGASDRPDDASLWRLDRFVDELHAVIQANDLRAFHLLGHSWAAALALAYVQAHPDAPVRALVLSSPLVSTPLWIADAQVLLARLVAAERAAGRDAAEAQRRAEARFDEEHGCRDAGLRARLLSRREDFGAQVYASMWGRSEHACSGSLRSLDLTSALDPLRMPVLLTRGEHDVVREPTLAAFARRIARARAVTIPGAAHLPFVERPEPFLAALRPFLRDADAVLRS